MDDLNIIMGVLAIIGSIVTAYITFEIYKYNRLNKAWLAVTWGFALMIIRVTLGFIADMGYYPTLSSALKTIEATVTLMILLFLIKGFWSMEQSFETFDILEKKTREKVRGFLTAKGQK